MRLNTWQQGTVDSRFQGNDDSLSPRCDSQGVVGKGVAGGNWGAIIEFYWPGRGGGIGRHAVLRGQWACACVGSNPALGTTNRSGGPFLNLRERDRQGDVAKRLRRRSAKPLCGGSNPPVASIPHTNILSPQCRFPAPPQSFRASHLLFRKPAPCAFSLSSPQSQMTRHAKSNSLGTACLRLSPAWAWSCTGLSR